MRQLFCQIVVAFSEFVTRRHRCNNIACLRVITRAVSRFSEQLTYYTLEPEAEVLGSRVRTNMTKKLSS